MIGDPARGPDEADPRRIATKSDFARELSLAKQSAGVSIRDIARAIDAPSSTVGGYLSGRHLPALRPPDQLTKILALCGITDDAGVELWRQALHRARRAIGFHASPASPVEAAPQAGTRTPPPDPPAAQPVGRSVLVSTRPPIDRLAQGPTIRGRDELLDRLARDLDRLIRASGADGTPEPSRSDVIVLHGLGGSGKSTVALAVAKMAVQRGIQTWWVSGADSEAMVAGMQALSSELGADPDQIRMGSPPDVAWRLLSEHGQPWLLVIDNADDPPASLALPGAAVTDGNGWLRSIQSGLGLILVTSRDGGARTWGERPPGWLGLIAIRPLGAEEGCSVLQELAGSQAGSAQEARDLTARLGGLPLALFVAGRHIAQASSIPPAFAGAQAASTFASFYRALDQGRHTEVLGGVPEEGKPGDLVGRTWELSLDLLATRGILLARPLLRLLSCLGSAPIACGLILRPETMSQSALFGPVTGRLVWETLQALAGLGIIELSRQDGPDPNLADVAVPHQLVRDASRRSPDVQANIGEYLALATALIVDVAAALDPKDPRTWGRWRALVDHSGSPLDLVAEFKVHPKAIPAGVLTVATLSSRFLRAAGELARAEAAYARTVRLGVLALGEQDPRVLDIQHDLSRVWYDLGRLNTAIRGLRAVLKARSRVLGASHPDTLTTQHYLARALRDGGQLDAAWRLFRRTLDARRATLGDEHPDTLTSRNNVADALRALGNFDRAGEELAAVLEARTRVLGEHHPATLVTRYNLARLAHDRDDLARAERELRELLEVYSRVLGADHPRTLLTRQAIIDVLHDRRKWNAALQTARELLDRRRALLGDDHPATLVTRHRIGLLLIDLGDLGGAETELAAVLAARRRVLGPRHPDTVLVCDSLNALRLRSS